MNEDDLLALRKHWYAKLARSGFHDIENALHPTPYLKRWESTYVQTHYTPVYFECKQEYFRRAGIFLHQHEWEVRQHKIIWEYHADGYSLREISHLCKKRRIKISKDGVHKVVTMYQEIMKDTDLESDDTAVTTSECEHSGAMA